MNRFEANSKTSEKAKRTLQGTNLKYKTNSLEVNIDLSLEVFLGAGRYAGTLTKEKETHKILCYAGSGVLPKTTYKELDQFSLFSLIDFYQKSNKDLTPDSRYFYSMYVTESSVFNVNMLNVFNGDQLNFKVDDLNDPWINNIFWVDNKSNEFVVVLSSRNKTESTEESNLDISTRDYEIIHFEKQGSALSIRNRFSAQGISSIRSSQNSFKGNQEGMVWAGPGDDQSTIRFHSYNFKSLAAHNTELDLLDSIEDKNLHDNIKLSLYGNYFVSKDFNQVVFQMMRNQFSGIAGGRRFYYLNIKSGQLEKLSDWFSAVTWTHAVWLDRNEFWLGNVKETMQPGSYRTEHSLVTERYVTKDNSLMKEELYSLTNYELGSIKKSEKNPNHAIVVYTPDFHYRRSLSPVVVKFDLTNQQILSELHPEKKWFKRFRYASYAEANDSMIYMSKKTYPWDFHMTFAQFDSKVPHRLDNVGRPNFFNFRSEYIPELDSDFLFYTHTYVNKKNFRSTNKHSIKKYEVINGEHRLINYLNDLSAFFYVKPTKRAVYMKRTSKWSHSFHLHDFINQTNLDIRSRADIPDNMQVGSVIPIAGTRSLILFCDNAHMYETQEYDQKFYIVTFKD